ncbi:UDP-N-acetylmuramoyl-tripeptide--D-alanyl-D-alanine ligase [Saonia flava]|uniref:UDP-N-acetylmuramoyl-tripeptide--D-alanyl-D-alanine ligase n=1 Tax=Saonia flava TaxID=523696 RepID=A0A846R4A9_9FLAO|nr:UDP-N-acetylmuramoyl-tripeptide--D-alanyl-D-alanine ligase [Saonia flava]NJB72805.1 UDP-N-acetylmuramoyl-tripeptide--D-alanyl-D-alanine ligase [Saonia flava]
MTIDNLHNLFLEYPTVCTDTRKIKKNSIFFALTGENFNGNKFALKAIENGAEYAIIDEEEYMVSDKTILVNNVLKTLQELSEYHRNHCTAKIIALTGSNGKTTTKELINSVLSKKYQTIATEGNLNNHIGVPLTLLKITPNTEIAIVEMGANHLGEIEFLCKIAKPDYGYITNFGKAHLEGFGGIEGVIKGKSELYNHLISGKKNIFLNGDDPIQKEKLGNYIKKIGFSAHNQKYYIITLQDSSPFISLQFENTIVNTQLIGNYNFTNCCAAILIGKYFNIPLNDIRSAIEEYNPKNNRSQIINKNGHHVILDAYNANPSSMKVALENFYNIDRENKILFLGDMFELGKYAEVEHQAIVDLITKLKFEKVFLIGENFHKTNSTFTKLKSYDDLREALKSIILKNNTILIKGSRGMALERILDFL